MKNKESIRKEIKMTKYKLTNTTFIKGELEFDKEQFEVPDLFRVDFSNARESYEYVEINGENTRTDKILKYSVSAKDGEISQFLEEKGMFSEVDELKDFSFEIVGSLEKVKTLKENNSIRYIHFIDYSIKPKWNSVKKCFDGLKVEVRDFEEE
jgi:hypothetical protein spneC1_02129